MKRCQACYRELVECGPATRQRFEVSVRLMDGVSLLSSTDFVELELCALCVSTRAILELAAELLEGSAKDADDLAEEVARVRAEQAAKQVLPPGGVL